MSNRLAPAVQAAVVMLLLCLMGCAKQPPEPKIKQAKPCVESSNSSHCEGANVCAESNFIDAEKAKIDAHKQELVKLGHMEANFWQSFIVLGRYDWHVFPDGYFGAYAFYEPAFEQAKRAWFLHGEVLESSNELWPEDDWDTPNQRHTIKFDKSIIGYTLPPMSMSWFTNGKFVTGSFTAKIIGISENGHTLILDKRAPHQAEQYEMMIVPPDWKDLCNCTNNFGPEPTVAPERQNI